MASIGFTLYTNRDKPSAASTPLENHYSPVTYLPLAIRNLVARSLGTSLRHVDVTGGLDQVGDGVGSFIRGTSTRTSRTLPVLLRRSIARVARVFTVTGAGRPRRYSAVEKNTLGGSEWTEYKEGGDGRTEPKTCWLPCDTVYVVSGTSTRSGSNPTLPPARLFPGSIYAAPQHVL